MSSFAFSEVSAGRFDPITLEVIRHRLDKIAEEMQTTLLKSSCSPIVKEGLDASASLFTLDGTTRVMREYSDRTALALLRMHRESAAIANETVDDGEWQEARDRIVARLERIRERDQESEAKA